VRCTKRKHEEESKISWDVTNGMQHCQTCRTCVCDVLTRIMWEISCHEFAEDGMRARRSRHLLTVKDLFFLILKVKDVIR
jgi:predicted molibdopterin-dependent oxidoreductase YjgC